MANIFIDGNQLIDANTIHENLLNNSVGAFPPDLKSGINYQIFDKSTVNVIKGRTYTLSCKTNGNLWTEPFNDKTDDNSFLFYLYTQNHSDYRAIYGQKNGSSVSFTTDLSGICVLCLQYKAGVTTDISKFPKVEQVKIELGNKATAWVPSSEDLANIASKMGG